MYAPGLSWERCLKKKPHILRRSIRDNLRALAILAPEFKPVLDEFMKIQTKFIKDNEGVKKEKNK